MLERHQLADRWVVELAANLPLRTQLVDVPVFLLALRDHMLQRIRRMRLGVFHLVDSAPRAIADVLADAISEDGSLHQLALGGRNRAAHERAPSTSNAPLRV